MICTEKERKSCNEEKLGCEGCYYNKPSKEEIKQNIASLIITYPMFTEMINDTLQYIDQLEAEITNLKQIEAEHQKINGDLRTEIEMLKEINFMISQL